ncbi:hypothetical protein BFC17_00470 [Alteromonas lipolytica]|uniref:ABC transporter permease n=2 Tax=Alteromonas lipolytica TaxID=1856405 RepID=A0A1E8FKB3_9ALTE|nr:hypothetical protein BFC17_00470 [Alteromonas lipolytica]
MPQQLITLFYVETLKLKRTSVVLMVFVLPLLVILFLLGLALKSQDVSLFTAENWQKWWMGVAALWSYFMLPLFIALISSAINGNEHKNEGWRLMLSLPVSLTGLYSAKCVLSALLTLLASLMLWFYGLLGAGALTLFGAPFDPTAGAILLFSVPSLWLASLPVLVIQHAISWRFGNIIIPLSVAVVATMGIVQIGSSEFWVYYPWSYMMMATLAGNDELRQQALVIAPALATALFWLSAQFAAINKRAG